MNQAEFNALCVAPSCTLRDALLRLDTTARGLLMVLSEAGQLVRTLEDWLGSPLAASGAALASDGAVTLDSGLSIRVRTLTGDVRITP